MNFLLIAVIIFLYSFQTLFCKLYTDRYPGRADLASPVFCVIEGVFVTLCTFAFGGFRFELSPFTLLMGVLNAVALFAYNQSLIQASVRGSYAFMNVVLLFGGLLVPSVYGAVFLNEPLSLVKIFSIAAVLVSCVLMNLEDIKLKNTSVSYYIFCVVLFVANGLYGTFVKMQTVHRDDQKQEMIMLTFFLTGVLAFIQLLMKEKKNTFAAFRLNGRCILPLAVCILSASLAINLLVLVLPLVDTAVLYTVENGGVLVLAALYAVLFFREKLRPVKAAGILLAVAAITAMSL
ncbi:MAG: EamA family transporter [Clostridia bacterium]|nr:EamA family transporter [Clostridia bacterium]